MTIPTPLQPPHDADAECAILGAMMFDPKAALEVIDHLAKEDFYSERHQLIFAAIEGLAGAGQPHDFITVADALRGHQNLIAAGGVEYLGNLQIEAVGSSNIRTYARIVREKSILRNVISASRDSESDAHAGEKSPAEVLDDAESRLYALRQRGVRGSMRARDYADLIPAAESMIEAARRGQANGQTTGLADLDRKLGGMMPGDLVILAGRPAMGKSALGINIAEHVARAGSSVIVFSMEMSAEQIAMRSIAGSAHVRMGALKSGQLDEREYEAMAAHGGALRALPLAIDGTPALTPMELRARARRAHAKSPLGLIVVDYLQLMHCKAENRTNEISEISRSLKALAKELGVPVLALSQLSRAVEQRDVKRPRLSDLRESGSIEQDADVVLMVYRDEYYNPESQDAGIAEIIIAKQRNGETGTVEATYFGEFCRFENYFGPPRSQRRPKPDKKPRGLAAHLVSAA